MELHKQKEYDFSFVKSLIDNEIEESIHIEFKAAEALSKADSKKKEISKDISAFANSNGGIIIYGITEKDHKAHEFSYIDGNEYSKEWLEQILNSSIQRTIPELEIFPIRKDGNIKETIYIVKIPESVDAPHICKDKRYYKRFNFSSVPMEEYEIRQLYGRRVKSILKLRSFLVKKISSENNMMNKYLFEVQVYNIGDKPEKEYKVNLYFEKYNNFLNISLDRGALASNNTDYTLMEDGRLKISTRGYISIYQNESVNVMRFNCEIPKDKLEVAINDVKVKISLIYLDGNDEMNTDLNKLLEIDE